MTTNSKVWCSPVFVFWDWVSLHCPRWSETHFSWPSHSSIGITSMPHHIQQSRPVHLKLDNTHLEPPSVSFSSETQTCIPFRLTDIQGACDLVTKGSGESWVKAQVRPGAQASINTSYMGTYNHIFTTVQRRAAGHSWVWQLVLGLFSTSQLEN